MQNGWSANHTHFRTSADYSNSYSSGSTSWGSGVWVEGHIGSIKADYYEIVWGDGTANTTLDHKILSRDNFTRGGTGNCTSSGSNICVNSTISEVGVYSSSVWTTGLTHTYPDNGTTEYVVYWTSLARANVKNSNGTNWRNETKVNIGGAYSGNNSPVSAVPPVVQVQDNTTFSYQVIATDADSDNLTYRWGTKAEFFNGSGSFVMPTGMT